MLYYNFNNAEGFAERFGIVHHGNGEKSRKNKILLAYIKQPSLFKEAVMTGNYSLINIPSMSKLKETMLDKIVTSSKDNSKMKYEVHLINYTFYSGKFETDGANGLCEDGDPRSIRYMNKHNGSRVFKMRAGKFFRSLILETDFGKTLPEQVLNWLCEELSQEWNTFTISTFPENRLFVNDNFADIYSSERCKGNFHSCMTDQDYHYYYRDSVTAKAAYLENSDGDIIARCIIFPEVYDEDGKVWRLAERQYSTDGNDIFKRALVDALIRGGHIDGFKQVGAGCSDTREFVDINGKSLADKKFYIDCNLETYGTLSYQDSFRYYNYSEGKAYNYSGCNYTYSLDTTEGSIEDADDEYADYDNYHDYGCNETTAVFVDGVEYSCDSDNLDDFRYVDARDEYWHYDNVIYCEECDSYQLIKDAFYSELTGIDYCCEACRDAAEKKFKEQNWYYSDFDQDYYEFEDEITRFYTWDEAKQFYVAKTISTSSLEAKIDDGAFIEFDGDYYPTIETDNAGVPFYYRKEVLYAVA